MNRAKASLIARHALVWIGLALIPVLLSFRAPVSARPFILHDWIRLVEAAVFFYANYFLFIPRFYFLKRRWIFFVANVTMAIIVSGSSSILIPRPQLPIEINQPPELRHAMPMREMHGRRPDMGFWVGPLLAMVMSAGAAVAGCAVCSAAGDCQEGLQLGCEQT